MKQLENFKAGFIRENPIFGLYLGLCSALAISTTLNNAIGMGVAVTLVLIMSNVIISCIRKITPDEIRIPVYIVVIATLVKIVQMLVQAYAGSLNDALGIFLPLIVVNCIILGRAEAFASKNGIVASAIDGLGMGLGYTCGLIVLSTIRQVLATGMLSFANPFNPNIVFFEATIFPEEYVISMFKEPVGAFFTFACLAAALTAFKNTENKKPWKIGASVVVVALAAIVGIKGNFMIDNTPAPEPEKPAGPKMVTLDAPQMSTFEASILDTVDNGDGSITYTVQADGFATFEGGDPNEFIVTVKDGAVVSVTVGVINDTDGIGTNVDDEHLAKFEGKTADGLEVEAKSGATITTTSALKAVLTALEQ